MMGLGRMQSLPNLRYCPGIFLEGTEESCEHLVRVTCVPTKI